MCRTDIPHALKHYYYQRSHSPFCCLQYLSTDVIDVFFTTFSAASLAPLNMKE
nr:MAG TPA: hypothetical protein [Bacteriophage sp.]